jgi:hypothetical protein
MFSLTPLSLEYKTSSSEGYSDYIVIPDRINYFYIPSLDDISKIVDRIALQLKCGSVLTDPPECNLKKSKKLRAVKFDVNNLVLNKSSISETREYFIRLYEMVVKTKRCKKYLKIYGIYSELKALYTFHQIFKMMENDCKFPDSVLTEMAYKVAVEKPANITGCPEGKNLINYLTSLRE